MAIREYLQLTQENAFNTFNVSPVRYPTGSFNQIAIRLDDSNAFTMRKMPIPVRTLYGGGFATPAYTVSDKLQLQGALRVKLCYSQAAFLLGWALGLVNSGQTYPWTTTEPVGDLVSCTVDHAIFYDDTASTFKRTRYLGCKVASGTMEISAESQECTLTLQLIGGVPQGNQYDGSVDPLVAVMPLPVATDFPFDFLLFTHSGGRVTVGSAISKYESLNINFTNKMDGRFFASNFVQELRSLGREISVDSMLKLDSTPDFRTQFEKIQPLSTSIGFSNGTNTVTMNLLTNTILSKLDDSTDIDKIYFRTATISSQFDPASSTDMTLTIT